MEINKETLLQVVSFLTNDKINKEDLTNLVEGDLEEGYSAFDALKPLLTSSKNKIRTDYLGEGYRKAAKKTENLLDEVFPGIIFESTKQDEMFGQLKNSFKSAKEPTSDSKGKRITLEKALQSEEVRNHIATIKSELENVSTYKDKYYALENFMGLNDVAMSHLNEAKAQFDDNPRMRKLQMREIKDLLSSVSTKEENGVHYILDEQGERKYNEETTKPWTLKEYILKNSPVKYGQASEEKQTKTPYTPSNNGSVVDFGFKADHVYTYDDYADAKKGGKTERAAHVMSQLEEQGKQE